MSFFPAVKFIDENGVAYGVKHLGNKPRVSSTPYLYDIAEGGVPDHTPLHIKGFNLLTPQAVDSTVGNGVGIYVPPLDAGEQLKIVSTSANDAVAGTGIQQVVIGYLDVNFLEQTEIITLNGLTPVNTVALDITRINYLASYNSSVGINGSAVGTITLTNIAGTLIYGQIDISENVFNQCFFTVPANKILYITDIIISSDDKGVVFKLKTTATKEGTYTSRGIYHTRSNAIMDKAVAVIPVSIPAKCLGRTDVMIVVNPANGIAGISASISGWYE